MKIIKGTILKVYHKKKGVFCGKAKRDFDTDKEEFYPIILNEPLILGSFIITNISSLNISLFKIVIK